MYKKLFTGERIEGRFGGLGNLWGIGIGKVFEDLGLVQDESEVLTALVEVIEPSQELGRQLRVVWDPGSCPVSRISTTPGQGGMVEGIKVSGM